MSRQYHAAQRQLVREIARSEHGSCSALTDLRVTICGLCLRWKDGLDSLDLHAQVRGELLLVGMDSFTESRLGVFTRRSGENERARLDDIHSLSCFHEVLLRSQHIVSLTADCDFYPFTRSLYAPSNWLIHSSTSHWKSTAPE